MTIGVGDRIKTNSGNEYVVKNILKPYNGVYATDKNNYDFLIPFGDIAEVKTKEYVQDKLQ